MNPRLQLLVRTELQRLLRPVEITDWVFSMVLVRKKNSKLRVCIDYRKLNAFTIKNYVFLHFILLLLNEVEIHIYHTFMDSYEGYNQISIALTDLYGTTFSTFWDTFIWLVISFGLCNVPATFQRLVMFISSNLLYKSMIKFVDDFSTQSDAYSHLACMRVTLKM